MVMVVFPLHHLIQDVAAGQNFTFYLLDRALEQQRVLHDLTLETSICVGTPLGREEWNIMAQVVNVLESFEWATQVLSGEATILHK